MVNLSTNHSVSRRIALLAIGCRTNQEELTSLRAELAARGHQIVDSPESADLIILNTCTVTGATESKVRRTINGLSRKYPQAKLLLTGCLAQQNPQPLAELRGVAWVVGNTRKHEIPQILESGTPGIFHENGFTASPSALQIPTTVEHSDRAQRTRGSVKIQEGCDYRCTYCIVPSVRGPSRCLPREEIVGFAKRLLDNGYKEIVLTGTHIGQYSPDASTTLTDLIQDVGRLQGDFRIRLSSLDPRDLTSELIDLFRDHPRLCPHLHLSVQSLSDPILSAMNRERVLSETILMKCALIRSFRPETAIGLDLIVGFPGETLEMFQTTLHNMNTLGPTYAHVFRFSQRPGTPAASFPDQIPEKEKTRRSEVLRDAVRKCRNSFVRSLRHVPLRCLVENESPASGLTDNYLRVTLPGHQAKRNEWITVVVEPDADGTSGVVGQLAL